jgi:hypothetical protein
VYKILRFNKISVFLINSTLFVITGFYPGYEFYCSFYFEVFMGVSFKMSRNHIISENTKKSRNHFISENTKMSQNHFISENTKKVP